MADESPRPSPLAVFALVVGLLGLCNGLLAPVGLVLGVWALSRSRRGSAVSRLQARVAVTASLIGLAVTGPLMVLLIQLPRLFSTVPRDF